MHGQVIILWIIDCPMHDKSQTLNIQEDWLIMRMLIGWPVLAGMAIFVLYVYVCNVLSYV